MKNRLLRWPFLLILVLAAFVHGQGTNDPGKDPDHSEWTNYKIARYVFASGGVSSASNENHRHRATAGEMCVGYGQGGSVSLASGFWHPVRTGTGIDQPEEIRIPAAFELHQNSPNPFNPQTHIQYELPEVCLVTVEIYNVVGQRIRLLADSQVQGPGMGQVVWDGQDDLGQMMGSGVYLYRVAASPANVGDDETDAGFQQTRKMVLVK